MKSSVRARAGTLAPWALVFIVPAAPVQQRERARGRQRRERGPHQVERHGVLHVQRHLEQCIERTYARHAQPAQLLQALVSNLPLAVRPRQKQLVAPQAEHQAHHPEEEPVQRAHRRGHELHRVIRRPRGHRV
eukprot:31534-Pelagococcus_subviridis.AAC.12